MLKFPIDKLEAVQRTATRWITSSDDDYDTQNLSEAEKSVLPKGLNFIPIRPTTDEFTFKEDCEKFYQRLCLKAFFHDKDQGYHQQASFLPLTNISNVAERKLTNLISGDALETKISHRS